MLSNEGCKSLQYFFGRGAGGRRAEVSAVKWIIVGVYATSILYVYLRGSVRLRFFASSSTIRR